MSDSKNKTVMMENIIDKVPAPSMPRMTVNTLAEGFCDISKISENPIVDTVINVM
jgi:hypothetical protein